jgi:hypothetical protein
MEILLKFAYYRILELPVIAWLGIITYIMLFLTALLEILKRKKLLKFSIKTHKTMAMITILFATVHGILVLITYI